MLVLMAALDAVWWVLARRLTKQRGWRMFISLFMVLQLAAVLSILDGRDWLNRAPQPAVVAVNLWHHLGLSLVLVILLPLGILKGYAWLVRNQIGRKEIDCPPSPIQPVGTTSTALSRREFIGTAAAVAPALFTIGLTGVATAQLNHFRVRRLELSLPTLPQVLDGVTIAHVSDIHVGPFTNGRVLRALVNTTNALGADLVLMTGDLINYELSDLDEGIDLIKQMPGRYGQWLIEGNHDLFDDGVEFERRVKASGVPFLRDTTAVTMVRGHPVQFLGLGWRDDNSAKALKTTSLLLHQLKKQTPAGAFPILLVHHPHAFDAAVTANLPLTLSGHTHGGYMMLNRQFGIGPLLFRYWSGLYKRGQSQLVVANGVGNSFPLRINAPAEIIHLTLRSTGTRA